MSQGPTASFGLTAGAAILMTAKDAAKSLAISPRTLWSLTASGDIQAIRIGRSVRYRPSDLEQFATIRAIVTQ